MDRQTRVVLYLAGWLLVASSGCASWPTNPLHTTAKSPSDFDSTLSLARLTERHGEPSTAEQLYQAVLSKEPQNQVAHHRLAVLATKRQQFEQAQYHFDQALAGAPNSKLLSDRGYFLYIIDQLPEAEAALRQSLQVDQGNIAAHNNLGLVLGTMGRLDESLAEFRQAGNEASAHANLGYVHSLNGAFAHAEAEYHHALELDSQLKPAAEALLALYARNDTNTAAALAYTPTLPVRRLESSTHDRFNQQSIANPLAEMANVNSPAGQSQIATVAYSDENRGRQFVSRATAVVESTRPLMNLPAVANPAQNAEPSTRETSAEQPAMQRVPAPMSLQSLQTQPWQTPTWTAQ